ncbi:IS66 family transposase [Actinoplanes sp. NPDC051343]|uniref:IS66 family transposase n=1 Tax=Actinoplanes sp. NPDC051343 TaxID=3363906 RepID=UPI0037BA1340
MGRTADALHEVFGVPVAPATVACWFKRSALGIIEQVLPVIRDRIAAAAVVHFDETGMRTNSRLAWLHSASTATDVLLSARPKRGTAAMDAAGVLPAFAGIAVHDAWAPYDTYTDVTHALCNAHVLRELVYVTDTATGEVADLAAQAINALTGLWHLVTAARGEGREPDPVTIGEQQHLLRSAVVLGAQATAARSGKLQRKHRALFLRLQNRRDDYLRFVTDPQVPFDNNAAEQTIRMPKLRIKVSGCMRTLTGAEHFAATRSYTPARSSRSVRPACGSDVRSCR